MIEIHPTGDKGLGLYVNGENIEAEKVDTDDKNYLVTVDGNNAKGIEDCFFSEIAANINVLYLPNYRQWESLSFRRIFRDEDEFGLTYEKPRELHAWKEPYSYEEYFQEFNELVKRTTSMRMSYEDSEFLSAELDFFKVLLKSPELTIGAEIERYANVFFQLENQVRESLLSKLRQDSVLTYFDFPEEVKVPCEQYLLYFVQFLRDLGVGATAELQQEAGQVLFAVTPTDKEKALDKIRVALEIYMRLPSSPVSNLSANDEIAIQRLEANIYHLKSQLKLAHAEVLTNERTI